MSKLNTRASATTTSLPATPSPLPTVRTLSPSVPDVILPPSRPTSPASRERVELLTKKIAEEVQKGLAGHDLACTWVKLRGRNAIQREERFDAESWPSPGSAEAWLAWEQKQRELRAARNRAPERKEDLDVLVVDEGAQRLQDTLAQASTSNIHLRHVGLHKTNTAPEIQTTTSSRDPDNGAPTRSQTLPGTLQFQVVKRSTLPADKAHSKPPKHPAHLPPRANPTSSSRKGPEPHKPTTAPVSRNNSETNPNPPRLTTRRKSPSAELEDLRRRCSPTDSIQSGDYSPPPQSPVRITESTNHVIKKPVSRESEKSPDGEKVPSKASAVQEAQPPRHNEHADQVKETAVNDGGGLPRQIAKLPRRIATKGMGIISGKNSALTKPFVLPTSKRVDRAESVPGPSTVPKPPAARRAESSPLNTSSRGEEKSRGDPSPKPASEPQRSSPGINARIQRKASPAALATHISTESGKAPQTGGAKPTTIFDLSDFADLPPPTFPQDLLTSTQQQGIDDSRQSPFIPETRRESVDFESLPELEESALSLRDAERAPSRAPERINRLLSPALVEVTPVPRQGTYTQDGEPQSLVSENEVHGLIEPPELIESPLPPVPHRPSTPPEPLRTEDSAMESPVATRNTKHVEDVEGGHDEQSTGVEKGKGKMKLVSDLTELSCFPTPSQLDEVRASTPPPRTTLLKPPKVLVPATPESSVPHPTAVLSLSSIPPNPAMRPHSNANKPKAFSPSPFFAAPTSQIDLLASARPPPSSLFFGPSTPSPIAPKAVPRLDLAQARQNRTALDKTRSWLLGTGRALQGPAPAVTADGIKNKRKRPSEEPVTPRHQSNDGRGKERDEQGPSKKVRLDPVGDVEMNAAGLPTLPEEGETPDIVHLQSTDKRSVLLTPADTPVKGLGNAKGSPLRPATTHPFAAGPQTPRRNLERTPTNPLLAISRRSLPRPRPPSRKLLKTTGIREGSADTVQTAPEMRTYLSSPASSSSSSPSERGAGPGLGSPDSPLDWTGGLGRSGSAPALMSPNASPLGGFTQNPRMFDPGAESTQPPVGLLRRATTSSFKAGASKEQGPPTDLVDGDGGSGQSKLKRLLTRGSSGLFAASFNSQYDIDGNVDQLSHFIERDVDFRAWGRDEDEGDDT